jgi:hypothetical protein
VVTINTGKAISSMLPLSNTSIYGGALRPRANGTFLSVFCCHPTFNRAQRGEHIQRIRELD